MWFFYNLFSLREIQWLNTLSCAFFLFLIPYVIGFISFLFHICSIFVKRGRYRKIPLVNCFVWMVMVWFFYVLFSWHKTERGISDAMSCMKSYCTVLVKLLMDYFVHQSCQRIYIVTCITDFLLLLFICVYLLISLGLCFFVCFLFFNADIFDLFLKYSRFFCDIIVGQV